MSGKIKVCAFVRVSKEVQDYNRQIDDITKFCESKNYEIVQIINEKISGAKSNKDREGIQKLIAGANEGDFQKIVVAELSRLGRNAFEVRKLIEDMNNLKISIVIQSLSIETLDSKLKMNPMVSFMVAILSEIAQMERCFLIDRINSGLERAKKEGKKLGRKFNSSEDKEVFLSKYPSGLIRDLKKGISLRKCSKLYDVSVNTCVKIKKMLFVSVKQKNKD